MKQLTLNFQNDLEPTGETTILSSPVGSRKSHANHTALPENEKAKMMNATCGQKCLEQYEKFPRHTLWGKTFMGLLIGTGDWFSMRCKLTWKLKGTKYSRLYFQLVPLVRHIGEKEYGLWPTIQTQGLKVCNSEGKTEFMNLNLLPTPTAHQQGTKFKQGGTCLQAMFLPTPDAASGKTGYMGKNREGKQQNLETVIRNSEPGLNSQLLNPQFVAEMMGFPVNWTELPFLSGETKVSKPMETQ